jgi:hypothetical protein
MIHHCGHAFRRACARHVSFLRSDQTCWPDAQQEDVQAVIQSRVKKSQCDERKQRPFCRRDDLRAEALALEPGQPPRLIARVERGDVSQDQAPDRSFRKLKG